MNVRTPKMAINTSVNQSRKVLPDNTTPKATSKTFLRTSTATAEISAGVNLKDSIANVSTGGSLLHINPHGLLDNKFGLNLKPIFKTHELTGNSELKTNKQKPFVQAVSTHISNNLGSIYAESPELAVSIIEILALGMSLASDLAHDANLSQSSISKSGNLLVELTGTLSAALQNFIDSELATEITGLKEQMQSAINQIQSEEKSSQHRNCVTTLISAAIAVVSIAIGVFTGGVGAVAIVGAAVSLGNALYCNIKMDDALDVLQDKVNNLQNQLNNLSSAGMGTGVTDVIQQMFDALSLACTNFTNTEKKIQDVSQIIGLCTSFIMAVGGVGAIASCTTVLGMAAVTIAIEAPAVLGLVGNILSEIGLMMNDNNDGSEDNLQTIGQDIANYSNLGYWFAKAIVKIITSADNNQLPQETIDVIQQAVEVLFSVITMFVVMGKMSAKAGSEVKVAESQQINNMVQEPPVVVNNAGAAADESVDNQPAENNNPRSALRKKIDRLNRANKLSPNTIKRMQAFSEKIFNLRNLVKYSTVVSLLNTALNGISSVYLGESQALLQKIGGITQSTDLELENNMRLLTVEFNTRENIVADMIQKTLDIIQSQNQTSKESDDSFTALINDILKSTNNNIKTNFA